METFSFKEVDGIVETWCETEIQNFLEDFIDSLRGFSHPPSLTIFIDALDEDDDEDIQQMVAFLEGLLGRAKTSGMRLRICLSSHYYPHISVRGNSIIVEEQSGHEGDIDQYVRARLLGGDETRMADIQRTILKKAAGCFYGLSLSYRYSTSGAIVVAECLSWSPSSNALQKKFNDLFTGIVCRDREDLKECMALFRWMLFSERPLHPLELCCAVTHNRPAEHREGSIPGSDDEISRYLLYHSRGLVELLNLDRQSRRSHSVQFIHETVRESLLNANVLALFAPALESLRPDVFDDQTQLCHAAISEECLTYLLHMSSEVFETR